jgi:type II secretory pathway component PulF
MARIGTRQLAQLSHNLGSGLHAGLDIRRILETQSQMASLGRTTQLREVSDRIASGEALALSFKAANGYFPPLFCEMVEVGERTGRLERVFFRLAEHYDQIVRLKRNFLMGIAWPMIELTLGILALGLFIYILGWIDAEWNGEKISLFGMRGTQGVVIWFGSIALIVAAIALPIIAVQRGWISADPLFRLLMHVPVIGRGLRIIAMSRLSWSLAMATDSDLPADRAVELAVRSTQNGYYIDRLENIKLSIRRGEEMYEGFAATGIYPPDFVEALQTGELSGRVSETMTVVAKDYDERATTWYRGLAFACGVTVVLLIAGLFIFMIIHLFTNLYLKPIQDTLDQL